MFLEVFEYPILDEGVGLSFKITVLYFSCFENWIMITVCIARNINLGHTAR